MKLNGVREGGETQQICPKKSVKLLNTYFYHAILSCKILLWLHLAHSFKEGQL